MCDKPGRPRQGRLKGIGSVDKDILHELEKRLGPLHARQRLAIEQDHEAQVFGQGLLIFNLENASPLPAIIEGALKLSGFTGERGEMPNASA